jgi:hypothetical protein
MNELGLTAPDDSRTIGEEGTTDAGVTVVAGVSRRPYIAPAIVEFGSVQEFTRGSGSATPDARRGTRVRSRG